MVRATAVAGGSIFRAVGLAWSTWGTAQVVYDVITGHTPPRLGRYRASPKLWRQLVRAAAEQPLDWVPTVDLRGRLLDHLDLTTLTWEGCS